MMEYFTLKFLFGFRHKHVSLIYYISFSQKSFFVEDPKFMGVTFLKNPKL